MVQQVMVGAIGGGPELDQAVGFVVEAGSRDRVSESQLWVGLGCRVVVL